MGLPQNFRQTGLCLIVILSSTFSQDATPGDYDLLFHSLILVLKFSATDVLPATLFAIQIKNSFYLILHFRQKC